MKSIRLSLIVYFLVLLTLSMGTVSMLVYRSMADWLRDKQIQSENAIHLRHESRCMQIRDALDRRLRMQALNLSGLARQVSGYFESLHPLGMIGGLSQPNGYLTLPGWMVQASHPDRFFKPRIFRMPEVQIENGDDLIPFANDEQAQEFFQAFHLSGQSIRASESLGDRRLVLSPETIEQAKTRDAIFEDFELGTGESVRAVVLRVPITRSLRSNVGPWMWWWFPPPPPRGAGKNLPFLGRPPFQFARQQVPQEWNAPEFLIVYASDVDVRDRHIRQLEEERDAELAELDHQIQASLAKLRTSLAWIFILTSLGLLVGSSWLLHLGLFPLKKLSEAVSKVSAKNFALAVESRTLPTELQPVAARLEQTLGQLRAAFEREKQAAADISHELRTPLAALLTTLEVGLRKPRSSTEYKEILEECEFSGRQMSYLVERLLALARLDAGVDRPRLRDADVSEIATECADLVRPLIRSRDLRFSAEVEGSLVVRTDPDKVREILNNLLHNAIEYNKPNGSIHMSVHREGQGFLLEVQDTGIGISDEAKVRIFERFYRADPSRHADTPHAGLGLSIVKTYVELMAGSIDVKSSPDGTTFRIYFPAEMATPTSMAEPRQPNLVGSLSS